MGENVRISYIWIWETLLHNHSIKSKKRKRHIPRLDFTSWTKKKQTDNVSSQRDREREREKVLLMWNKGAWNQFPSAKSNMREVTFPRLSENLCSNSVHNIFFLSEIYTDSCLWVLFLFRSGRMVEPETRKNMKFLV